MFKRVAALSMVVGLAAACGETTSRESDAESGAAKQEEVWGRGDAPSLFSSTLEYRFSALPTSGEAATIPWVSSYWPTYEDNVNYQWAGEGTDSPALKYQKAFGGTNVEDAVSRYHGIDSATGQKSCTTTSQCNASLGEACAKRRGAANGRCIPTWWGICHAWSPAAILLPEPKRPVTRNGVTFRISDLKALGSLVHNRTSSKFVSLRCDQNNSSGGITFDAYGRPTGGSSGCKDTNPGTFHVLLANYLGKMKTSFVEDRTFDSEVWNQPLRSFRVLETKTVTAEEANRLVGASGSTYVFNADAKSLVYVRSEVKYISESRPEVDGNLSGVVDRYTGTDRYEYILELDAAGKIFGGEWVGSSKKAHPDFVWLPTGVASTSVAGGAITYANVKSLFDEATTTLPGGGGQTVTENATIGRGELKLFGPFPVSAADSFSATMTGTGDADLYVRSRLAPTLSAYDCRPYREGSGESCTAAGTGEVYVGVHGYAASSTIKLVITYK